MNGTHCMLRLKRWPRYTYHVGFGRVTYQVKSSHCKEESSAPHWSIRETQVGVRAWVLALLRRSVSGWRCWDEQGWWAGDGVWQKLSWMHTTQLLKGEERGLATTVGSQTSMKSSLHQKSSEKCWELFFIQSQVEITKITLRFNTIPEGGESLYSEAGLLPLNRKPDSEESEKT